MYLTRACVLALGLGWTLTSFGAAPATPSYFGIESTIAKVQASWQKPGAQPGQYADGWNALFAGVRSDLTAYGSAKSATNRYAALTRLEQVCTQLQAYGWAPVVELREEMQSWLKPRINLAWAERRLIEAIQSLPATADTSLQTNRKHWVQFVDENVGNCLQEYESAGQIREKRAALGKVYAALNALNERNKFAAWGPSIMLQQALSDLYNGPNLHATADVNAVAPRLANNLVESGPVYRKGQISYVTAGPFLGFGLMASDDGIVFYNRQALSSVTPVNGFQQQISSNPKGRKVAKLYEFGATTYDQSTLTVIAVLRPSGLQVFPDGTHATDAQISSAPQPGKGLARGLLSLIGFNQQKITQKVYDGAIGEIRSSVVTEAREETGERTAVRTAETNAQLSKYLIGNNRLAVNNLEIDALSLRSRPEFVLVDGRVLWRGATEQLGADLPKPSKLNVASPGISADVHIASIASNLARGYLQGDEAKTTTNLLVVTRKIPPGAPATGGVEVSRNADFATFLKAVDAAQALNDPKVLAIRVKNPGQSPEFSVDRNGFLVALVHDFQLEVPAPESARKGGLAGPPARIYRLTAPNAEFAVSFQIAPAKDNIPLKLTGRIEGFDPGPGAQVYAINDDDTKPQALSPFQSTIILGVFGSRLKGQPIDAPLTELKLPGLAISSVSDLDPTGWLRVVLTPTGEQPVPAAAQVPPTPGVASK